MNEQAALDSATRSAAAIGAIVRRIMPSAGRNPPRQAERQVLLDY
jgi:hypothetical protein